MAGIGRCKLFDFLSTCFPCMKNYQVPPRLANKQDKEGALSEACLIECLSLDKLVNEQKCVCQMKGCSTVLGTGKKIDKSIRRGLFWLLNCIGNDFDGLKARVERDTKAQQVFEEMEKQERAERVRQLRKEREEREKEHATEHPEFSGFDSDIDSDPFIANPFQPINAVLMENERRKRRMDKDIDCIIQRPYTEQEKSDMQSQFNNGSQRTFDDCICTDPYRVLSYIRPTEKEIDNAQSSECADSGKLLFLWWGLIIQEKLPQPELSKEKVRQMWPQPLVFPELILNREILMSQFLT